MALGGEWERWGVGLTEWALSSPLFSLHPFLPLSSFSVLAQGGRWLVGCTSWLCKVVVEEVHN